MIKTIMILMNLVFLSGCVYIGFNKGSYPDHNVKFERYSKNENIALKIDKSLYVEFSSHQCGYYGLVGIIIPIIPYWKNINCGDLNVGVNTASNVYLKHVGKIYNYNRFNPKTYYEYTSPIPAKSISDGAILIVEKHGQTFEIPFHYQHAFSFELWGK